MRRTLPVVVIVALVATAVWYYMLAGDGLDAPPEDSAQRSAEPPAINQPDSEIPLVGRGDENSPSGQTGPVTPSPGATTTDSALSSAGPDDGERSGASTTTSTRASDDSLAEPAADTAASAAPAAQDDGNAGTEQPIVENRTGTTPTPTLTHQGDQPIVQSPEVPLAVSDDVDGVDTPVSGPAESERASSAVTPPGLESKPAGTLATVTGQTETEEPADVETTARSGPVPIPANRADRSVTQEQVISVVPDDTVERVTIREPVSDDAMGGDTPVTGPAGVGQTPESALAAAVGPIETDEPANVETLAQSGPLPTPANRADQSVTQEQVISVVPDDTVERVTIRDSVGDDAIGGDIPVTGSGPVTGPAAAGQKLAGTLATATEQTETDEPANVETLTQARTLPVPTNRADQSVTQEQVISVVPDETVERVTVREHDDGDAIAGDAPVTGPEAAGQKLAGTLATAAEQTETDGPANVETQTQAGPLPVPTNRADQSVTQERVISVVPDETVERVTVREHDGGDAIAGDAPVTGPDAAGQKLAGTLATATEQTETDEPANVETLTQAGPLPVPTNRADQSVTQERVISVVPDETVERVTVREHDGGDAIAGDAPVTGPAAAGQKLAGTLATGTEQTETDEPANVETLTQAGTLPVPTSRADQSVTQERVISVVPDETVERVTVREHDGGDAIGGAAPVTGPDAAGQKLAGTLATATEQTETDEPANVETLTQAGPLPVPTNRADQSVTQERVISVVPDETVERVTVREHDGGDAIGGDAPVTGPDAVGQKLAGTLTTGTEQTETDEPANVETLSQAGPLPAPANRADQSVTQERVISVVPDDTIERVTIREPDGDDAIGGGTSVTGPAAVGQKLATTLAAVAADVGAEVKRIVETLTDTTPQPDPADRSDPSVSGEPSPKPNPTDGTDLPVSQAKATPPVPDETIERDANPGLAADIETEAQKFVETLTEPAPQPIPADRADHFVTQEQVISLVPDDIIERVTVRELAEDDTIGGDTPITVVRETDQIETITQERLIVESGGDDEKPVRIPLPSGDQIEQTTIGDIVADRSGQPARLVQVVRTVRHFEVTTLNDLLQEETNLDSLLGIIRQPYRIEVATLADLLQKQMAENPDSIFYLHTVLPTDEQGIWGIVHFGLIDNFARGVAIRRGENVETYTVRIPRDADERLEDHSSSFLGKLIDNKTKESFVYNFRKHRMGRNPDRIYPGQELVIINFKPEELVAIYAHFAGA